MSRSIRRALRSRSIARDSSSADIVESAAMAESWRNRKTLILELVGHGRAADARPSTSTASSTPTACTGSGASTWSRRATSSSTATRASGRSCRRTSRSPRRRRASGSRSARTTREYELPAVFSILIYTHPETGFPLAICDGSYHTLMRTGASAAVLGEVARAQGLEGARDPRQRARRPGDARDLRRRCSSGTRCGSGAGRRSRSTASSRRRRRSTRTCAITGTTDVSRRCAAPT